MEPMAEGGLRTSDLYVSVAGNEILKGIDLTVGAGSVHALMGPNGSGKSTLAFTMAGHPNYRVERGSVTLDGEDLLALSPDKRAKAGLFLSFQYPAAIPGVSVANFLRAARQAVHPEDLTPAKFRQLIFEKLDVLDMDVAFMSRYVNDGFSGGEKKRLEMLQLSVIAPKYAILDETDSGLNVDALRAVGDSVDALRKSEAGRGDRIPHHHALPAHPALHRPGSRAHHARRQDRRVRRSRTRRRDRARRLRRAARRGRECRLTPSHPATGRHSNRTPRCAICFQYKRRRTQIFPLELSERAFRRFEELPVPGGRGGRGWKHDYAALGAPGFARLDEAGPRWSTRSASLADDIDISRLLRLGLPMIHAAPNDRATGHLASGIRIEDALALRPETREVFDAHVGGAVRWADDKFAALALALAGNGASIRIQAGTRVARPLLIEHGAAGDVDLPYIQVIVEDGAAVTIVEDVTSGPSFACGMVEIIAGEGASVDYVVVQRRAPESTLLMTRGALCARDATCRWFVAELGAGLSRSVITTRLAGPGANAEADAFFFTDGDQHVDLTTVVEHEVGSTTSRTAVKSAATGKGQGRYLGNIRIAQHATGSDATLRDDVLLLNEGAHIDSIPALEIASNDVKAFHGATIGSIDAEELFYAESRGIARPDAERMIALGFFEPLVARFPEAKIREALTGILARKLVGGATEESAA